MGNRNNTHSGPQTQCCPELEMSKENFNNLISGMSLCGIKWYMCTKDKGNQKINMTIKMLIKFKEIGFKKN